MQNSTLSILVAHPVCHKGLAVFVFDIANVCNWLDRCAFDDNVATTEKELRDYVLERAPDGNAGEDESPTLQRNIPRMTM